LEGVFYVSGVVKAFKIDTGFELIPRETLQDKRISLQALGLLVNICSYSEEWELYKSELYKRFTKNKETSVRNAWNELMDAGYVMEKRERNGKKWDYEYRVRLVPWTKQEQEDFLGTGFSSPQNEVPKMKSSKPSSIKEDIKENTKRKNTNKHNTHHHPIIENFNQHQSNLLHEVIKEEKIDDDLQGKLFNRLQGRDFSTKAYILKSLNTAKNEVSAAYSSGSTRVVKAPAYITQPNFEHVETYDDLQQKLDKLEDSLNAGTITQEQYEESKDFYMSLYETDDSDEKRAW
jgi:hypothetical protein